MEENLYELYRETLLSAHSPVLKPGGAKFLSDKYIPPNPLYRRDHILRLSRWIYDLLDNSIPGTIFLEGPPGTGKTMCFTIVRNFVERRIEEEGLSDQSIVYVNARNKNPMSVLAEVLNGLGIPTPSRGLSYGELLARLSAVGKEKSVHICVDEVDQLKVYPHSLTVEDLLYHFSRTEGLSLTTITNDYRFVEDIEDARVRSSITKGTSLIFERYNKKQCFDILTERCRLAFLDGAVPDGVVEKLADYVSETSGDIRDGLEILRNCATICREEKLGKVTEDVLSKAIDLHRNRRMVQKIHALSKAQKLVLAAYLLRTYVSLTEEQKTEDVFEMYLRLREREGKGGTIQDVRARISDLVTLNLLQAIRVGKGPRRGVERKYRATIPTSVIYNALKTDPDVSALFRGVEAELKEQLKSRLVKGQGTSQ